MDLNLKNFIQVSDTTLRSGGLSASGRVKDRSVTQAWFWNDFTCFQISMSNLDRCSPTFRDQRIQSKTQ